MPNRKRKPTAASKAATISQRATLADVANAAAALAAHIREHLPIQGEPPPPSGGPHGGQDDFAASGLWPRFIQVRFALMTLDAQAPERPPVEIITGEATGIQRDAIDRIRAAHAAVARCYGFDRLEAGERIEVRFPAINPAAVRMLEWGAKELLGPRRATDKPTQRHPRKRRGVRTRKPRPLTARQVEVIETVAQAKGNIAEAARRLGRNRKTIEEIHKAGWEKVGKVAYHSKDKTRLLVRDRRGQENVCEEDDKRRQ